MGATFFIKVFKRFKSLSKYRKPFLKWVCNGLSTKEIKYFWNVKQPSLFVSPDWHYICPKAFGWKVSCQPLKALSNKQMGLNHKFNKSFLCTAASMLTQVSRSLAGSDLLEVWQASWAVHVANYYCKNTQAVYGFIFFRLIFFPIQTILH